MATTMNPKDQLRFSPENRAGTILLLGIAMAALGVIAVASSVLFTVGTVMVLGGLLVVAGVVEVINAFRAKAGSMLLSVVSALVYLVTGILLLNFPVLGAITLTLLVGIFLFTAGIVRIVEAIQRRGHSDSFWFLVGGILNIILGAIIVSSWPVSGLWVIGLFVGIELIMHGVAWIGMATAVQSIRKDAV